MTTHARPERRSLFPDGADLPLMTAPQVPRSVDSLRSMWAACEQLYLTDPMQAANAGEELMRLDAERYRSVDVLGWRGHDHPLDHHTS